MKRLCPFSMCLVLLVSLTAIVANEFEDDVQYFPPGPEFKLGGQAVTVLRGELI